MKQISKFWDWLVQNHIGSKVGFYLIVVAEIVSHFMGKDTTLSSVFSLVCFGVWLILAKLDDFINMFDDKE